MEGKATRRVMEKVLQERSFVISRSSFPGAGMHVGKFLGDIHSIFYDMYISISGILNFQLFGIPMVGADICGFKCTYSRYLSVHYGVYTYVSYMFTMHGLVYLCTVIVTSPCFTIVIRRMG